MNYNDAWFNAFAEYAGYDSLIDVPGNILREAEELKENGFFPKDAADSLGLLGNQEK